MRTDKGYTLPEFVRWTRLTHICAEIDADLREMLGEVEIASRRKQPADISM